MLLYCQDQVFAQKNIQIELITYILSLNLYALDLVVVLFLLFAKSKQKAVNCINYRGGWFAFHAFKTCCLANTGER
ncbi:hypothetical protein BTN98_18325 [Photobacterium aquimaris]|uniref:Uncharacterized protein n=1 Tax=Photobacterium aquimaris TaxID=512643 RepID=A0A2T3I0J4_9GAMM|nr:hypothetical protein AYY21_08460 [Photobacterium aquimaris]PQJ37098.1 hypothetical protein BTN98_18325 [Photobacterium aquimaris]PSU10047.1 hypothetical protein C0W81_04810 [Photobacterium aquimaris]